MSWTRLPSTADSEDVSALLERESNELEARDDLGPDLHQHTHSTSSGSWSGIRMARLLLCSTWRKVSRNPRRLRRVSRRTWWWWSPGCRWTLGQFTLPTRVTEDNLSSTETSEKPMDFGDNDEYKSESNNTTGSDKLHKNSGEIAGHAGLPADTEKTPHSTQLNLSSWKKCQNSRQGNKGVLDVSTRPRNQ